MIGRASPVNVVSRVVRDSHRDADGSVVGPDDDRLVAGANLDFYRRPLWAAVGQCFLERAGEPVALDRVALLLLGHQR